MTASVPRRSSLILRWLLLYAALFSLLVGCVLALVSWTTLVRHESAADRELQEEARRLQDQLSEALGASVSLKPRRGGRGSLVIDYASLEQLDGLVARLTRR